MSRRGRRRIRAGAAAVSQRPGRGRIQAAAAEDRVSRPRCSGSNRPFANLDPADNVFKISGDQVNYGVEATLTGRVVDRLIAVRRPDGDRPERHQHRQRRARTTRRSSAFRASNRILLTEYQLPLGRATFVSSTGSRSAAGRSTTSTRPTRRPTTSSTSARATRAPSLKRVTTWRIERQQRRPTCTTGPRSARATSPAPTSAATPRISARRARLPPPWRSRFDRCRVRPDHDRAQCWEGCSAWR